MTPHDWGRVLGWGGQGRGAFNLMEVSVRFVLVGYDHDNINDNEEEHLFYRPI